MLNEKILIRYSHLLAYSTWEQNAVGVTTSLTLRTVTAHTDANCKYVRKFGNVYGITAVTDGVIDAPRGSGANKAWYEFYDQDDLLLGTIQDTGSSTFVAGTAAALAATAVKIKVAWKQGTFTITNGDTLTVDTDLDAGGLSVVLPGAVLNSTTTELWLYLSSTGSTYYDSAMKYGGARHTPDYTAALPGFTITAALAELGGSFVIVTVLDSASYDEAVTVAASLTLQSALGQTPRIVRGVGARVSREVTSQWNNSTAVYFNGSGNDSTGTGTWQLPWKTADYAITNAGALAVVMGGDGAASYTESVASLTAATPSFEADYGYIYTINSLTSWVMHDDGVYSGVHFMGSYPTWSSGLLGTLRDCTASGMTYGFHIGATISTGTIRDCNAYNCGYGIYLTDLGAGGNTTTFTRNLIANCTSGGIYAFSNSGVTITHNVIYNSGIGIHVKTTAADVVENNTAYGGTKGISFNGAAFTGSCNKNIAWDNSTYDLFADGGVTPSITNSVYGTNSGFTIGAGCTTSEVYFTNEDDKKFGLQAISSAYKLTGNRDVGALWQVVRISSDTAVVNGFEVDGLEQYFNGIVSDGGDFNAKTVKFCTIHGCLGIGLDDYSTTASASTIISVVIYGCGSGIVTAAGGLSLSWSLIYNNDKTGAYIASVLNSIDHVTVCGNYYGIQFTSTFAGAFRNSIIAGNSFGIVSLAGVGIDYCDIMDSVSTVIDTALPGNISENPLFISLLTDSEDFRLKSIETGYSVESPCLDIASDGWDMGCYKRLRTISDDSWSLCELDYNPRNVDFVKIPKGLVQHEDSNGKTDSFAKDILWQFVFKWPNTQVTTKDLVDKATHFASRINTRRVKLDSEQRKFRISLLQTQFFGSGTGTIDASAKTLTDSTKAWNEDEKKGFWIGVKFATGTDLVIAASAKTAQSGSVVWTVDQWTGYFLPISGLWYRILSNTADTLNLSDPDGNLVDGTISWSIEKYFKILGNSSDELELQDDNEELIDGAYAYYVDFIECILAQPGIAYTQARYYFQEDGWKNGFQVVFQET